MVPVESTSTVKGSDDLLRLIGNPGRFQIILYLLFYALSVVLLGLAGYFLLNWHDQQAFIAVASVVVIPLYWFFPESLKWLLIHNRPEDVDTICVTIARFNGIKDLPSDLEASIRAMAAQYSSLQTKVQLEHRYTVLDCVRTPYDMRASISSQEAPLIFMGVVLIILLVAVIVLPETTGTKLLNTIEEAEAFGKAKSFWARVRDSVWF
ncbi:hypothetical protein RvY_16714 [Ramazzottius varieornatus]|uniref:Major facilitator superfamily (MFS) profile domain-containing protein n=1 Tax=Ramazzottius varieornatus TaxID=947166 RepID=A0A1D1W5S5_RAMVA|nr:hypothetical protein RvY_16714 [Ramazzottius varieornatus]